MVLLYVETPAGYPLNLGAGSIVQTLPHTSPGRLHKARATIDVSERSAPVIRPGSLPYSKLLLSHKGVASSDYLLSRRTRVQDQAPIVVAMQEEDYEVLRNRADADPARYSEWDPNRQFRHQYEELHRNDRNYQERTRSSEIEKREEEEAVEKEEEVAAPLSRHTTASSSSSSSGSSNVAHSARLEEIRTAQSARTAHTRDRAPTVNSQGSGGNVLHLHPTERNPEAIRRIETHRSQHAGTVGAQPTTSRLTQTLSRRRTEKPLPSLGAGKPFPPPLPDREEYVVEFDGAEDPLHPQNWPMNKKLYIGAILAFDALAATMGSSIFSAAIGPVSNEFGVIQEVSTLGTSLFVFGYAFGPLIWAPWSELYGRKPPIIIAAFGFSIFTIAVAVAKDLQTIMLCRFFSGLFGSSPLAIVAAVFADMFNNKVRGLAVAVFSATVFMGPLLAPFIGGFITTSSLGWRWTEASQLYTSCM